MRVAMSRFYAPAATGRTGTPLPRPIRRGRRKRNLTFEIRESGNPAEEGPRREGPNDRAGREFPVHQAGIRCLPKLGRNPRQVR